MESRSDEKIKTGIQINITDIDFSRRNKSPFILDENDEMDMKKKDQLRKLSESIEYQTPWLGPEGVYEFRFVTLTKAMLNAIPEEYKEKSTGTLKLLWEEEWRNQLGITQSMHWEHYEVHRPEPHKLLFRRSIELRDLQRRLDQERLERSQRASRKA